MATSAFPVFPAYAKLLRDGYEEAPDFGVIRTSMESGVAKQRPTKSIPVVTRPIKVFLQTRDDQAQFRAWVRDEINGGTGWFNWPDPLDGQKTKQASIVSGAIKYALVGLTSMTASFNIETLG